MKAIHLILNEGGEVLQVRLKGDGASGKLEFIRGWAPGVDRGPVLLDEPAPILVIPASALRGLVACLTELCGSIDWEAFDAGQEVLRLSSGGPR